jgi:hypothetical protein
LGESVKSLAVNYTHDQRDKINFAWNGKHAAEFKDDNLEFRKAIAEAVVAEPDTFPLALVSDLLQEEALCSRQAWGVPRYYMGLLTILLNKGGREHLRDFAEAMNAIFDTFGASHAIEISVQDAELFLVETDKMLASETDNKQRANLESAKELFQKIIKGEAAKGWVYLPPGTPVKNIKVHKVGNSMARRFEAMPRLVRKVLMLIALLYLINLIGFLIK